MNRIVERRVVWLTGVVVAIGCWVAEHRAVADTIALQDWSGAMEYTARFKGVTGGYEFTVGAIPIVVTKLGIFDDGANGLSESHAVGLWKVGDPTALVTVTLTTNSPLEGPVFDHAGQFRFERLSSVLELSANTSYRIGAYYSSGHDDPWAQSTGTVSWTTASEISFGSPKYHYGPALSYPSELSGRAFAYIGPNLQFVLSVPEPGTLSLLLRGGGGGLVLLGQRRWLRRKLS